MERKSKLLLTGITGFIGSELAPRLVSKYDVYGLVKYVTGRVVNVKDVTCTYGDLTDFFTIRSVVRNLKPDYVIHLAAISPVASSYDHPHEYSEANFLGTLNLAEACLREVPNLKQFIMAGTSEEYGNQTLFPIKESAVLRPNSPYAVSKVAADNYLMYMWEAYKFPVTVMRPFNSYGRKSNRHFIVEKTMSQMLSQNIIQLGDPTPTRDFLFVDDHVNGYLAALGNEKALGEHFNVCTGRGVTIFELVQMIRDVLEWDGLVEWNTVPARPLDIDTLIGDNWKAEKILGWKPIVRLEKGLKKTYEMMLQISMRPKPIPELNRKQFAVIQKETKRMPSRIDIERTKRAKEIFKKLL